MSTLVSRNDLLKYMIKSITVQIKHSKVFSIYCEAQVAIKWNNKLEVKKAPIIYYVNLKHMGMVSSLFQAHYFQEYLYHKMTKLVSIIQSKRKTSQL